MPGISSQILAMSDEQLLEIALPALLYLVVFLVGTVGNAMVSPIPLKLTAYLDYSKLSEYT